MSFGKDDSQGQTNSRQSAQARSFISGQQIPFLQQLFEGTGGLLARQAGQIGGAARDLSADLSQTGQQLLGSLGAQPGTAPIIEDLNALGTGDLATQIQGRATAGAPGGPLAGSADLSRIAAGEGGADLAALLERDPTLDARIGQFSDVIQRGLRATAGTIAGQATLQGATGGARQALATGIAGEEANRNFAQGALALESQDFAARQALAPQIQSTLLASQLQASGQLQGGDLAERQRIQQQDQFGTGVLGQLLAARTGQLGAAGQLQLGGAALQADQAQAGLGALPGLFNLGLAPFSAEFAPFLSAAGIFGPATVLSESASTGRQRGRTASSGFEFGFV